MAVGESDRGDGSLWAGDVSWVEGEEEVGCGEGEDVDFREGKGIWYVWGLKVGKRSRYH